MGFSAITTPPFAASAKAVPYRFNFNIEINFAAHNNNKVVNEFHAQIPIIS